jgi:hypothetical protein
MANNTKSNDIPQHRVKPIDIEDEDQLKRFQVPSFVNSTSAWWFGQDIYIDMALLTVDEMLAMPSKTEVNVAIYGRYAMSIATFDSFFQRLNELREQLKIVGLIRNEQTKS